MPPPGRPGAPGERPWPGADRSFPPPGADRSFPPPGRPITPADRPISPGERALPPSARPRPATGRPMPPGPPPHAASRSGVIYPPRPDGRPGPPPGGPTGPYPAVPPSAASPPPASQPGAPQADGSPAKPGTALALRSEAAASRTPGTPAEALAEFARDLRELRSKAGLGYPEMAELSHYTMKTLASAAGGMKLPTLPVTAAYVRACGGNVAEWEDRWHDVAALVEPAGDRPESQPERPGGAPAETAP
ncbi:MAG TPA: helix-turn-helix domain-containing protein, partial [Streptosporangiaceae bacterium]